MASLFQVMPEDTLIFAVLDMQRHSVMRSINFFKIDYLLTYATYFLNI